MLQSLLFTEKHRSMRREFIIAGRLEMSYFQEIRCNYSQRR